MSNKYTFCIGITNLFRIKGKLYGNLFFDIDDIDALEYNTRFKMCCEEISKYYRLDIIIIKSGNKKTGYHLVIPEIFKKVDLIHKFDSIKKYLKMNDIIVDNIHIKKTIDNYYKSLSGNKINLGNVLRIGSKHNRNVKVKEVFYSKYPSKRKISKDLLFFYLEKGLLHRDFINLINRHDVVECYNRINIYKTKG